MSSSIQASDHQPGQENHDMTQLARASIEKPPDPTYDDAQVKARALVTPESSLTDTLPRDSRTHLDPLNTMNKSNTSKEDRKEGEDGTANTSATANGSAQPIPPVHELSALSQSRSLASPPVSPPGKGNLGLSSHRSMLKALASRSSSENLRQHKNNSHSNLSDLANPIASFAARFTHTPCFFHKRFDGAVNVDRILEEIAAEEDSMSHSRLMHTATSVREISKQLQRRPIKRAVRTIMIVTKARDNRLVYLTRELTQFLLSTPRYASDLGVTVYVDAKLAKSRRFDAEGLIALNPNYRRMLRYWTPELCCSSPEKFDLVLTLGGDGTVLYTSWLFQRIVPPILSFSLGSLGFLTNFAFPAYKSTLDRIMEGSGMRVNMRMRFTCTVYRSPHNRGDAKRRSRTSSLASTTTSCSPLSSVPTPTSSNLSNDLIPDTSLEVLNELVLDRGPSPYVSNLELYGDTQLLTIIQADGCIISTPTGSTAYSLSAGGPLCHPSIPGILLTPICPHTLSFRPMVLSDTLLLRLVVPKNSRSTAYASFDGKGRVELRRGDEVRVEAGRYPFPTVVGEGDGGGEWFESVRRALRWNTRGVVQGGWGGRLAEESVNEEVSGVYGVKGLPHEEAAEGAISGTSIVGESEDEEEEWDIDADPIEVGSTGLDSGIGGSVAGGGEEGSGQVTPARKMPPPTAVVEGSGLGLD